MNRRDIALAGHRGDVPTATTAVTDPDPVIRSTALRALARCAVLTPDLLAHALCDADPTVRRAAAQLAAQHRSVELGQALTDADNTVVEMAAWAAGEHEDVRYVAPLALLVTEHADALVREAAVGALGAIGDPGGLAAILTATRDKPAIRRRAVIALTPFDGPEVDEALERARADKDWQVRMVADELS